MEMTLFKIAEKCKYRLGSGDVQSLVTTVIDVYATVVKNEWYENRADGVNEVDGVFIYSFGKDPLLTTVKDSDLNMYYITIPSSYLRLPHEMGINLVCCLGRLDAPFVRIAGGSLGMWLGLKAAALGGAQTYFIENTRMYFPKMKDAHNIYLKQAIAFDYEGVDVDEALNIPPNVVDKIVDLVFMKYQPKPPVDTKELV